MKRALSSFVALLFLIPAGTAFADHFRSRDAAAAIAHRLADDTERFHRSIHRREGLSYLSDQAHVMSNQAERIHRMIEAGVRYEVVARHIERLQARHAEVRESLLQSLQDYYDQRALIQWTRVSALVDQLVVEAGVDPVSSCTPRRVRQGGQYRWYPGWR